MTFFACTFFSKTLQGLPFGKRLQDSLNRELLLPQIIVFSFFAKKTVTLYNQNINK